MKKNKLSAVLACGITLSLPFILTGCEALDGMFDEGYHNESGSTHHSHGRPSPSASSSSTVTTTTRSDGSRSYSNDGVSNSSSNSAAASASNAADDPSSVVTTVPGKPRSTTTPAVPLEAPALGQ